MSELTDTNGMGLLQRRAAQLRAEAEAKAAVKTSAPPPDTGERSAHQPEPETSDAMPAGEGEYVVQQGDCITSIAKEKGYFWETLWDDPGNANLKATRQDPNVLFPGDRVTLPHKGTKQEPGNTELRHRFRRRGEPGCLRLVVMEMDEPVANQPYVLKVGDRELHGVTDPNGRLEQPIPSNAQKATLIVGEGEDQLEHELSLGGLDPINTTSGVQARLENLGYEVGPIDGVVGPRTTAAIEKFCGDHDLPPPGGRITPVVREKLREVHGF